MNAVICSKCEYYKKEKTEDYCIDGDRKTVLQNVWNCGIADEMIQEEEYREHLKFIKDELEKRIKDKEWDE